jgi:hypothetical protein
MAGMRRFERLNIFRSLTIYTIFNRLLLNYTSIDSEKAGALSDRVSAFLGPYADGPINLWSLFLRFLTPMLQKPEGFRANAPRLKPLWAYCEPLATRDLEPSGFPEG